MRVVQVGSRVSMLSVCVVLAVVAAACGGDDRKHNNPGVSSEDQTDGGSAERCVDKDGDGFGKFCKEGVDCDDGDPDTTDECVRCVKPNKDCPCDPQPPVFCKPSDREGDGGVYKCAEGSRFCREGYWSDCEAVGDYVFVRTN